MNVIFNREVAEQVKEQYLVLELETFPAGDKQVECFCIIEYKDIPLEELQNLGHYKKLHEYLVEQIKANNYSNTVKEILPGLKGKFAGELDSFYDEIINRIEKKELAPG